MGSLSRYRNDPFAVASRMRHTQIVAREAREVAAGTTKRRPPLEDVLQHGFFDTLFHQVPLLVSQGTPKYCIATTIMPAGRMLSLSRGLP